MNIDNEAMINFLNDIYNESRTTLLSNKQIKEIEDFLTDEEKDIVRRGRNSNPHSTAKNADIVEYKYATGFEALIGWLYLNEKEERLEEILKKCVENA